MGEFLIFLVFLIAFLALSLYGTSKINKELRGDRKTLCDEVQNLQIKLSRLTVEYNTVARTYNRLLEEKSSGSWTKEVKTNPFTSSEIKRLKHYLHPDKHGGKTDDLFIRVSQLGEK